MLSALKGMNSILCLCHCLNTVIYDGWKSATYLNEDLEILDNPVSNLKNSLSHATDIQKLLPEKSWP